MAKKKEKKGQDFIWCVESTEEKEFDFKKKGEKKAYTHTHTHGHSKANVRERMVAVCDLLADQLSLIPPLRAL